MTAPDPRLYEIQARLSADWEASMSGGYIGDDQCMKDRDFLLAELRKAHEALARAWDEGHSHCFHVEDPANSERNPYRAAVAAAKGDGE